jgi:hypothetical protein
MRKAIAIACVVTALSVPALAQINFNNMESYCAAISDTSSTILVARTNGIQISDAESLLAGMTDPFSIRLVKEALEFAYSRPATRSVESLRAELRNLCLAKKIFVQ